MSEEIQLQKNVQLKPDDIVQYTDNDSSVSMNDMITMASVIHEENLDRQIDQLKKEKIGIQKEITSKIKEYDSFFEKKWENVSATKSKEVEDLLKFFKDQDYSILSQDVNKPTIADNSKNSIHGSIFFGKKHTKNEREYIVPFKFTFEKPEELIKIHVDHAQLTEKMDIIHNTIISLIDERSNMANTERKMKAKATMSKLKNTDKGKDILKTISNMANNNSVLTMLEKP